jgi:hypothetical protein
MDETGQVLAAKFQAIFPHLGLYSVRAPAPRPG